MDTVFHKYRADSAFTEAIITSGKVFLATAHQLNDPFECSLRDIANDWTQKQIDQGMQAALVGFVTESRRAIAQNSGFFGVPTNDIEGTVDLVLSAHQGLDKKYEAYRNFIHERTGHWPSDVRALFSRIDAQLVETGIFSLSTNPAQPLMWAHYGGQHNGLCLGFRASPGSKLAHPDHCLRVNYSPDLPSMAEEGLQVVSTYAMDEQGQLYSSSFKVAFTDKTFQRVVATKSMDWLYEEEVRYIEPYSGLCDWPGQLVECTFGLRFPEDRRLHYIELLKTHVPNDVALFEIRPVADTHNLQRLPLDPPFAHSRKPIVSEVVSSEPKILSDRDFAALMSQLMQQEKYGEVIFQTGENLKSAPDSPVLLHIKASAHGMAGDHAEALEIFRKLTERFPDIAGPWYGIAVALEGLGRLHDAIPALRRAADIDQKDPSIALNLGVHLARDPATRTEGIFYLERAERLGHRRAPHILREVKGAPKDELLRL